MKQRAVALAPEARDDLLSIYDWVAVAAGPLTALDYVERIEEFCQRPGVGSERGQLREDIRPGLRIVGFERRVTVALVVVAERVVVLRLFYRGRNWEGVV